MKNKLNIIHLKYNNGYKWFSNEEDYVKGYIFDNDILYKDENLLEYFSKIKNVSDFKDKIKKAKGLFSVIIKREDIIFVAVDKVRTFPLYYFDNNNEFIITDDTYYLKNKNQLDYNQLSIKEFLFARYVTGKETLLENVFQIQAGEYLIYNNNKITNLYYHDFLIRKVTINNFEDNKKEFLSILKKLTQRLVNSVKGKTIVIPLSSGYDSRLIASLLKMYGYKNVICFTYGEEDSVDVSISKNVAKQLGFEWIFVNHHKDAKEPNYINSTEFINFSKLAYNHTSIIHLQDYFVVKQLKLNNLIPPDSIFVPGHSGDMLVGNHLYRGDDVRVNNDEFVRKITKRHYVLEPYYRNSNIELKLKNYYSEDCMPHSLIDNYNLKERQSKFIVNSVRVYEYFGYSHRMPLWDEELVQFFKTLDFKSKLDSSFYKKVIFNDIFKPLKVDVIPPDKQQKDKVIKRFLKQISSQYLLSIYRKHFRSNTKVKNTHPYSNILNYMNENSSRESINIDGVITNWIIDNKQLM
ncbi:MAG: asparagine synthase C-terminal domain-containing protein [Flavobacteriaceae bacterium]|nr:asparagine synthase C-terminal domain-containing protein [Flavobacteriaceae bacterium]